MTTYTIILAVFVAFLILSFAHWSFYKTLVRFLGLTNSKLLFFLKIALPVLLVSLIASFILASRYFNFFTRLIYTGAMGWLGILYYLLWAVILLWLFYGISRLLGFSPDTKLFAGIFFSVALFVAGFGIINADIVRVTKITVSLQNLPSAWQGKTAVWVSDVHLGQVRNFSFAQKIADMVQEQKPDIVFIGGDLYDGAADGTSFDLNKLAETFGKISSPLGTYFITGNHEEFGDPAPYLDAVKNAGIKVLLNEKIDINGLQIIGVDDRDSLAVPKFTQILQSLNIDATKPSILLKHSPFDIDIAKNAGVSLQISGHSHQGQIFPNSIITHFVYKGFDYGLNKTGDMFVYTSSGTGTWGPPLRVGAAPEIVVVKFE
ncbi:MAG: metallophosphoesterase [bacterium]